MNKDGFNTNNKASDEIALQENELKKAAPNLTTEEAKKIRQLITRKIEISQSHSGPLPHPNMLLNYNKIKKGFAERIVQMAEKEQSYRHMFTDKMIFNERLFTMSGIISGLIITLIALIGGIILTLNGCNIVGFAAIIGSLVGLVTVFIVGNSLNKRSNSDFPDD